MIVIPLILAVPVLVVLLAVGFSNLLLEFEVHRMERQKARYRPCDRLS